MSKKKTSKIALPRELGDGLVLRRVKRKDIEALVAFNARIHGNIETKEPDERVGVWTRDLLEKPHPSFEKRDFTVVEDTSTGMIVSSLALISQTWSYGGIPFGVGRPEIVGTDPKYRRRGLVRAQFEVIHQWSAERGQLVQAITGIPYYYRQFGYEMGLALGGGRLGYLPHVPELKEGENEPYVLRAATIKDIPFLAELYESASLRYLVNCIRDEVTWRYDIEGKSEQNVNRSEIQIIESDEGVAVGFLVHPISNWGPTLALQQYEVKPGVSWAAVTPSVIRYMKATGEAYYERDKGRVFGAFGFWLGSDHPVYEVIPDKLPRVRQPYAYYIRVADLVGFISHIAPVLEERLEDSLLVGHSGELKISFYRDGLKLVFKAGSLVKVERWQPEEPEQSGDVTFPELVFLQLLFGYRSLEELEFAFADCYSDSDEATALLNVLFPVQASNVWPVA
jgi:hypothetical protein